MSAAGQQGGVAERLAKLKELRDSGVSGLDAPIASLEAQLRRPSWMSAPLAPPPGHRQRPPPQETPPPRTTAPSPQFSPAAPAPLRTAPQAPPPADTAKAARPPPARHGSGTMRSRSKTPHSAPVAFN
eukprot:Hpha_TRINITY_DN37198_c0_g1::TRINITY_DN37198_c0_g1_i1::g.1566::m.1566